MNSENSDEVTREELAKKVGEFIEYDHVSKKCNEERVRVLAEKFVVEPLTVVRWAVGVAKLPLHIRKQIMEFINAYNAPVLGED